MAAAASAAHSHNDRFVVVLSVARLSSALLSTPSDRAAFVLCKSAFQCALKGPHCSNGSLAHLVRPRPRPRRQMLVSALASRWILSPMAANTNLTVIRLLRFIRILRALRIVRTFEIFAKLRILVSTVIASFFALFWSIVLLSISMLISALLLCQARVARPNQAKRACGPPSPGRRLAHGLAASGTRDGNPGGRARAVAPHSRRGKCIPKEKPGIMFAKRRIEHEERKAAGPHQPHERQRPGD